MKKIIIFAMVMLFATTVRAQFLNFGNETPEQKLRIAEMAVTNLYVEDVDETKLVEDAIRGMLKELDPHSSYSTAKETKALTEPLKGSFEGIGVQFNMAQDTLLVIQTIANGPSEKVGILAGDRIVAVNDTAIAGVKMTREDIMRRLRGKKGSKVNLTIVRRGIQDKLNFVVTRDKIDLTIILKRRVNAQFVQWFNVLLPVIIIAGCTLYNHQMYAIHVGTLFGLLLQSRITGFFDRHVSCHCNM